MKKLVVIASLLVSTQLWCVDPKESVTVGAGALIVRTQTPEAIREFKLRRDNEKREAEQRVRAERSQRLFELSSELTKADVERLAEIIKLRELAQQNLEYYASPCGSCAVAN